jgi:hypothetical protein
MGDHHVGLEIKDNRVTQVCEHSGIEWNICIRCEKRLQTGDTHTCTPCPTYRAGMNEGELIQQKLYAELQAKYENLLAYLKGHHQGTYYECMEDFEKWGGKDE